MSLGDQMNIESLEKSPLFFSHLSLRQLAQVHNPLINYHKLHGVTAL